jgi:hypothetical protein
VRGIAIAAPGRVGIAFSNGFGEVSVVRSSAEHFQLAYSGEKDHTRATEFILGSPFVVFSLKSWVSPK